MLCTVHILLYSENYNYCASPSWLGPAPTRSALTSQVETGRKTQILRCPPIRPFSYPFDGVYPERSRTGSGLRLIQSKLFSLGAEPAQAQALPSPCGRGGVYYCRLYQISHLPVKYNFLVMQLARLFEKTMQKCRKGRDTSLTWCNFFELLPIL